MCVCVCNEWAVTYPISLNQQKSHDQIACTIHAMALSLSQYSISNIAKAKNGKGKKTHTLKRAHTHMETAVTVYINVKIKKR